MAFGVFVVAEGPVNENLWTYVRMSGLLTLVVLTSLCPNVRTSLTQNCAIRLRPYVRMSGDAIRSLPNNLREGKTT